MYDPLPFVVGVADPMRARMVVSGGCCQTIHQEQKQTAAAVLELLKVEAQRERRAKAAAQKRKATGVLPRHRSRTGRPRGSCGGAVLPSALVPAKCFTDRGR